MDNYLACNILIQRFDHDHDRSQGFSFFPPLYCTSPDAGLVSRLLNSSGTRSRPRLQFSNFQHTGRTTRQGFERGEICKPVFWTPILFCVCFSAGSEVGAKGQGGGALYSRCLFGLAYTEFNILRRTYGTGLSCLRCGQQSYIAEILLVQWQDFFESPASFGLASEISTSV